MATQWDLFFDLWPEIASVGWNGFSTEGRGAVFVELGDDTVTLGYRGGTPCSCHSDRIDRYDPGSEVVVVLLRESFTPEGEVGEHSARVLQGWPLPPEAGVSTSSSGTLGSPTH